MQVDNSTPRYIKGIILVASISLVFIGTVIFGLFHYEDNSTEISFNLIDQNGNEATEKNLHGKHSVVFFGFTNCIDVCPAQMGKVAIAAEQLSTFGVRNAVQFVFVSIDPARDTEEKLNAFLEKFSSNILGLTGSTTALRRIAREFNSLAIIGSDLPHSANASLSAHSSVFYVLDTEAKLIEYFTASATAKEIAVRINELVSS